MLTRELLRRLRRIEIETSRLANQQMAGQYRSVFKGHGMSFEEVRPYQAGDDIRVIDWNVSARTGELFVKRFVEERELTVFLLLDMSRSADFGTVNSTRRDLIALAAGILAFSAIRNNDRVGLIIFTDRVEHMVPPKKGKTHVLRVLRDILDFRPAGGGEAAAGICDGLRYLMKVTKKTSVAFLVSDFLLSPERLPEVRKSLSVVRQRHDVVPLVARDPMDEELPDANLMALQELERGEVMVVRTSRGVRAEFRRQAQGQRQAVETVLKSLSLDFAGLSTEMDYRDYASPLIQLFRRRARRR